MEGISNEAIVNIFENETGNDFTNFFVGVSPSSYVTRFISFHEMMIEKNRYPFIIMKTDWSNKKGTHWWSFPNLHPRKEIFFIFDSFGFEGFKEFIIDGDRKALNKILFGIKKLKKTKHNKVTLVTLKCSMREYEKTRKGHRLTTVTQDLLHVMYEFGKLHKINDVVTVHLVDDQLQKIETDTCVIFQLCFYVNLLALLENSSIVKIKNFWNRL